MIWTDAESGFVVDYALPVLEEIEFTAGEGFRRISRGGIETGGLLFGAATDTRIEIAAFRNIECEHAFGPSFQLSERDIDRIKQQLAASATDTELAGLKAVGWWIAHTRSELVMNDREAALFAEFFPAAPAVTLLVKPEKFKPTRFALLVRKPGSDLPRDGTSASFILPLPGQAATEPAREPRPVAAPIPEPPPTPPPPISQPVVAAPKPEAPTARPISPAPLITPPPPAPPPATPVAERTVAEPRTPVQTVLPELPRRRARLEREPEPESQRSFFTWLVYGATCAAICIAAYGYYLRSQVRVIPVTVVSTGRALSISWPVEATRDASSAEIRVNDNDASVLSETEKDAGSALLPNPGGDVKVELLVHGFLHEGAGSVRMLAPTPSR